MAELIDPTRSPLQQGNDKVLRTTQQATTEEWLTPEQIAAIGFYPIGGRIMVEPVSAGPVLGSQGNRYARNRSLYRVLRVGNGVTSVPDIKTDAAQVFHDLPRNSRGDERMVITLDDGTVEGVVRGREIDEEAMKEAEANVKIYSEEYVDKIKTAMLPLAAVSEIDVEPLAASIIVEQCPPKLMDGAFKLIGGGRRFPIFKILKTTENREGWPPSMKHLVPGTFVWAEGVGESKEIPHNFKDEENKSRSIYMISVGSCSGWYPGLTKAVGEVAA